MKYQILFSGKNKKNVLNLSSADLAQSVVKVKGNSYTFKIFCLPSEKSST